MLKSVDAQISITSAGEPEENIYAELFMRSIKEEAINLSEYEDFADALRQLGGSSTTCKI